MAACLPQLLTVIIQHTEAQQGHVKHHGSVSGSFPVSNGVKQERVLDPALFPILFSRMLREAKEDLSDGIHSIIIIIVEYL